MHSDMHKPICKLSSSISVCYLDIDRFDEFVIKSDSDGDKEIVFPMTDGLLKYIYIPTSYTFTIDGQVVSFPDSSIDKIYWKLYKILHRKLTKYWLSRLE